MTNTKSCHAFFHVLRLYCRDRSPKVHSELITKEKMMYREGFKETVVPVVTMVLYFGTETRWNKPTNIKALMDIPRWLDPYVTDYKINVFEIVWLSEKELDQFQSDFRIIARFFVEKRKNPNYIPEDPMEIEHVDEFLKLMAVLTGDNRYVDILRFDGKEIVSMCDVAARLENIGLQKGRAAGLAEGDLRRLIKQTCKKMQTLLSAEEIADDLAEDDVALIQKIMDAAKEFAPEYDIDAIYEKVAK